MKNIIVIIFGLIALSSYSQKKQNNSVFRVGENLKYEISYNWGLVWLDAGVINFSVKDYKGKLRLIGTGKTYKSYDWMFKVRDTYQSVVEPSSLDPIYFKRNVDEGGYIIKSQYKYNKKNKLIYSKYKVNDNAEKLDTIKREHGAVDIVTLLYKTRLINIDKMKKGDVVKLHVVFDNEITEIQLKHEGVEKVKIKSLGKYNSVKFSVNLIGGDYFEDGEKMYLWVSNDKNRIPLMVEAPILIGKLKMHIVSHEGLKYDMASKL